PAGSWPGWRPRPGGSCGGVPGRSADDGQLRGALALPPGVQDLLRDLAPVRHLVAVRAGPRPDDAGLVVPLLPLPLGAGGLGPERVLAGAQCGEAFLQLALLAGDLLQLGVDGAPLAQRGEDGGRLLAVGADLGVVVGGG